MKNVHGKHGVSKLSLAGLLITLGIVYGDIGTSPLYVFSAVLSSAETFDQELIFGAISCIFWTLTLQTTLKYVLITLSADNKGEGGIFALFALIRRKSGWAYILAIIGGSTLLADGIITPSITVTSAAEGLKLLNGNILVIPIVLTILTFLFFIQQFGSKFVGRSFGPIMLVWFLTIACLGVIHMVDYPQIFGALNPQHAINIISKHPQALLILGAVFLATTGAEALYSDLGHCGAGNIRISWILVKVSLILCYMGQGVWVLQNPQLAMSGTNPFFAIMPSWFLVPGVILATLAAIIASQALISGSFTLVSEAISLNFWPKLKLKYPSEFKGQIYIPEVNWFLWAACCFVVLYFKESAGMQAAYGLSITITMLMTTLLLSLYIYHQKVPTPFIIWFLIIFLTLELTFLYANIQKFWHGGWFTVVMASLFVTIMYYWYHGRKIKNKLMSFVEIDQYVPIIKEISQDTDIPKYATNLVYITKANTFYQIESKIMFSIINKKPKRADVYWFLHVDITDEPFTFEYAVNHYEPGMVIKVDFRLGYKIEPRITQYFRQVLDDLVESSEIDTVSRYKSLKKYNIPGDFQYILIDRISNNESDFTPHQLLVLNIYETIRTIGITEARSLGLDTSNCITEKVPLVLDSKYKYRMTRK